MLKFSTPVSLMAAALAVVCATGLHADIVTLKNGDNITDVRISTDTLSRIAYEGEAGGRKDPWDIGAYRIARKNSAQAYEAKINSMLRAGFLGSWKRILKGVDAVLALQPPSGYSNVDFALVRIRYYKVRALAETGQNPATAYDEFVKANKAYAALVAKEHSNVSSGVKVDKGAYKGIDCATLHATTVDSLVALGIFYRSEGDFQKAFKDGYEAATDLSDFLRKKLNKKGFITNFGIPAMQQAAFMYSSGETPDWKSAAKAYQRVSKLANAIGDNPLANRAKMKAARCNVELGNTSVAARTYTKAINDYEKTIAGKPDQGASGPPAKGWLTPMKAAYYAAAYTGMGHVRFKEKKYFESLQYFAKSLGLFSTDLEVRADALLHAGLVTVELARKSGKNTKFYHHSAEAYYQELWLTLAETKAGKRIEELRKAVEGIKPKEDE